MNYTVLYNPLADNENGEANAQSLSSRFPSDSFGFTDITSINDYKKFFSSVPDGTDVIICGGDGTLNHFINNIDGINIEKKLLYYPCGSGNDFARSVEDKTSFIPLNDYIKKLPIVTIHGRSYKFINGIGFGIDGYCCETGDAIREKNPKKKINYTSIAIKGLLFHYKPTNATVIVDGKEYRYKKVWLAPVMYGKYYGGGMMPAPLQERNDKEGRVSVMTFHDCGKLRTLTIFPSIFKGTHTKYTKNVTVLSGRTITVRFDSPRPLQVDGETIKNVTEYTVKGPCSSD